MKLNKLLAVFVGLFLTVTDVFAAAPAHPQSVEGSLVHMLPMLVLLVAVFYFLLIRPQSKRAKEHKQLLSDLSVGDEIVTTGGVVGRVVKLKDGFFVLATGKSVEMYFQKNAIHTILPKGTVDIIE